MTDQAAHTVIITGGASGLGAELAKQLARLDTRVYIADLNRKLGDELVSAIRAEGRFAQMIELDVANADAMSAAVQSVVTEQGRLDLMINNAGYAVSGETQDVSPDDWQRVTSVNFLGVVHGSEAAYAVMRAQGSGQIVNIASMFGLVSVPVSAPYVATKHAVVGYTKSLRYEAEAYGVKVNLVCPGFIDTQIFENAHYAGVDKDVMLKQLNLPLMPVDQAARRILKGIERNKAEIIFPWSVYVYRWLDRHLGFLLRLIYRKVLVDHRRLKDPSEPSA